MSGPTARIARHTLAYGVGSVVGGLARAVLLPVVARTLAPGEYGVLSLLLAVTNFAHVIFEFGLVTALIRFHHETDRADERRRLRALVFSVMPVLDLVIATPFVLARDIVSRVLFGVPVYGGLVVLAIGAAFAAAQFQLFLGHLRADDRSREFAVLMSVKGGVSLAVTLVLVLGTGAGVRGFLLGTLAGPAVVAAIAVPRLLVRAGRIPPDLVARLAPLLRFGLPLVPSAVGLWILSYLDSYLLRVLAGLPSVGIYGFATEICLPIALLVSSLHLAWPTFAFSRARREGGREEVARVFRHFLIVLTAGALAVSVLRREILAVLATERYAAAADVIPILALATVLYGVSRSFETGLQVAGDTRRLPLLVLFAAALNAGLNAALIPGYREVGAAWATVITDVVLGGAVLWESNRQLPIPFELGKALRILLTAGIVFAASERLPELPLLARVPLRVGLCLAFAPLLVPLGALSRSELKALPAVLGEVLRRGVS